MMKTFIEVVAGMEVSSRMSGDCDPLPPEIWQRATQESVDFVTGAADRLPIVDIEGFNPYTVTREPQFYGDDVMTPRRVEAICGAAEGRGEHAQRLLELVGIDPITRTYVAGK